MLIYAGIDEAGYGPMLGPLCVAATAFVIADDDDAHSRPGNCDLWKRLKKVVCRKRGDRRKRIAIDDSKKLKLPNDSEGAHPLKYLERGVLSFLASACDATSRAEGALPTCDDDLFQMLRVNCSAAPWYCSTTSLPIAHSCDELQIAMSRVKCTLASEGIACPFMRCEAIDVEPFNRQVEMMGTKSSVNFCAFMRLIDAIWTRWPAERTHIVIDRQGGRTHYLNDLLTAYRDAKIQILQESDLISQYRLERSCASGPSTLLLSFCVEAEASHLPVALASMTAKYIRELCMIRFNRYFRGHLPELKPTAGYTEDARRYLVDIESLIAELGIDRRRLVRSI